MELTSSGLALGQSGWDAMEPTSGFGAGAPGAGLGLGFGCWAMANTGAKTGAAAQARVRMRIVCFMWLLHGLKTLYRTAKCSCVGNDAGFTGSDAIGRFFTSTERSFRGYLLVFQGL